MTDMMTQAPAIDPADETEEPADLALRRALGVRPSNYFSDGRKGEHPDPNPCPTWCWVARETDEIYGHEVGWSNPMRAHHHLLATPTTVASLYSGTWYSGTGDRVGTREVVTSSIETQLEQIGTREPMIRVSPRHWPDGRELKLVEKLRLRVEDARELITALTYVCDVADGKREPVGGDDA
ncbi:hypothetical protein D9V37_10525 [Nocardioides mangrovicus]|uniref:Uncharacterized protein n=1 Tax=Nocardioides mangrovicus TaxID=2478913 RepID=A0A3L8P0P2_9ACTN|nr:hypothetical protein [Nocardioides mangrovicus]RLV49010.1 hypothetical protein D9V37_10525 [Nocardioides mangrovicus]